MNIETIIAFVLGIIAGGVGAGLYLHTHQSKAIAAVSTATAAVSQAVSDVAAAVAKKL